MTNGQLKSDRNGQESQIHSDVDGGDDDDDDVSETFSAIIVHDVYNSTVYRCGTGVRVQLPTQESFW